MSPKQVRKAGSAGNGGARPAKAHIARVLIDDNRLMREGITAMIHTQPGFKVLAAFADEVAAFTHTAGGVKNLGEPGTCFEHPSFERGPK